MTAYYNEINPTAAQWLRNLIAGGHIAPGVVDERSIEDVTPDDLRGFTQCHFFAGVGVWSYALRLAGWPDNKPVWTGSCPCQPFSQAGKGAGFDDERHLWPAFFHLISECRPNVVFGEQVASKDGLAWLELVQADLEATDHASGAVDLCAAGVGAPHIRQRLFWVANPNSEQCKERNQGPTQNYGPNRCRASGEFTGFFGSCCVAYSNSDGWERRLSGRKDSQRENFNRQAGCNSTVSGCSSIRLANACCTGRQQNSRGSFENENKDGGKGRIWLQSNVDYIPSGHVEIHGNASRPTNGFWRDTDWMFCRDGKWRPVEPGSFPLVDGAPNRVGRLRAYGNAINAEAAKIFIAAYKESQNDSL